MNRIRPCQHCRIAVEGIGMQKRDRPHAVVRLQIEGQTVTVKGPDSISEIPPLTRASKVTSKNGSMRNGF